MDEAIFDAFTRRFSSRFIIHANATKLRKPPEDDKTIGTVDYGNHFIGPHSELAFLPRPFCPVILFFHGIRQATRGGATTVYDGQQIAKDFDPDLHRRLSDSRLSYRVPVPREVWTQVLGVDSLDALRRMQTDFRIVIGGLRATSLRFAFKAASSLLGLILGKSLASMESDDRHFGLATILEGPVAQPDTVFVEWDTPLLGRGVFSGQEAFATSLFTGYTKSLGRLNGKTLRRASDLLARLQTVCEPYKTPIEWRGGDLIMVDNTRMMHGRESFEDAPHAARHVRTRYAAL